MSGASWPWPPDRSTAQGRPGKPGRLSQRFAAWEIPMKKITIIVTDAVAADVLATVASGVRAGEHLAPQP